MNRAFVALDIKALDDDARTLEGWATTVTEDRIGDIVIPSGAKYTLPMPFLLDHDSRQVVGEVESAEIKPKGIKFTARIKKIAEPGAARDLCDYAWSLIKNGLRRSVSIGFRPITMEALPTGGLKFTEWDWYELSAVGIPAQPEAVITSTKSYSLDKPFVTQIIPETELEIEATIGAAFKEAGEKILANTGDPRRDRKAAEQQAVVIRETNTEIPAPPEPAASGKEVRVVRLNDRPASRPPYQIREIIRTT